jgi:putative nucleotidyltransferase with HDIG domain
MTADTITRAEVITRAVGLPSFPSVVTEILASLDDPEANLKVLTNFIAHDPVIAARVLSFANRAAERTRKSSAVRDIYTATSLIGMSHVREITLVSSMSDFVNSVGQESFPSSYWEHSVAVGICAQEVAIHIEAPIVSDTALIAGLLHDIGQLWLYRFYSERFAVARKQALIQSLGIEIVEREAFCVDHSQIGAWLAEHWELPKSICSAIRHHHQPDSALSDLLVPVVSIAEVISSALDLTGRPENRVTYLSKAACTAIGLTFDNDIQPLFGRIEARSKYANALFASH